jgi:hypothetical protein
MAELKVYEVEINGWPTTVQLNDEDAKARGLAAPVVEKARTTTANKARRASTKGA